MRPTIALLLLAACSTNDGFTGGGLALDDVENIPAGNGTGTRASGDYELEMLTVDCRGRCPVVHDGIFSASTCDINELDYPDVEVTQTDGVLSMDADGLLLDRLTGGIDADGSFVVGAWGTESGIGVFLRSTGTLDGDHFTATAEAHGIGIVDGVTIDCTGIYEITGERVR